jgi:hypothetical protein
MSAYLSKLTRIRQTLNREVSGSSNSLIGALDSAETSNAVAIYYSDQDCGYDIKQITFRQRGEGI